MDLLTCCLFLVIGLRIERAPECRNQKGARVLFEHVA